MMKKRIYNFAGSMSIYPESVLQEIQKDIINYQGSGYSVLELSHRSEAVKEIIKQTKKNIRHLLQVPDNYHILFLQGGQSLQFSMIPMNFLRSTGKTANYIVSGYWSKKGINEGYAEGDVHVSWHGKADNFTRIPQDHELDISTDPAYLYYTSNETVEGIQFQSVPEVGDCPLICDMCSDFISRPVDVSKFALISAHAQKNAGHAGVSVVIVKDELLQNIPDNLHTMLDYRTHVEAGSIYNTPPVFSIYTVMVMTRWLINEIGGLDKMEESTKLRSSLLYRLLDKYHDFYIPHALKNSRSLVNVAFTLPTQELTEKFIEEAGHEGLTGLKGHRMLGGIRASLYNPMPMEGVSLLTDFMEDFRRKHQK